MGDDLAALSLFVAASYCRVETRARALVQFITVVDNRKIDLGPLGSVVGLVQL